MAEENETEDSEAKKEKPEAAAEEKKSGSILPIIFMLMLLGGLGTAYVYLDEKVQVRVKKFDRVWADKQVDLRSMARQRMYDTSQSHLQTEMMDRWRQSKGNNTESQQKK
jgi:hypothetical protein